MNITAKLGIGDTAWCMYGNEPYSFVVKQVNIKITEAHDSVETILQYGEVKNISAQGYTYRLFDGNLCFATKKELLDSFLTTEEKAAANNATEATTAPDSPTTSTEVNATQP